MSIDDDPSSNEMQSSNPAHLESYLKGLFEIPSQNIEAAFQLVLDLIKQQSGEIDELKKAYQEATSRNDELSVQIERASNDIAKERVDVATTLDDLKRDRDQLLASQEKTQATIVSIQQEIKVGHPIQNHEVNDSIDMHSYLYIVFIAVIRAYNSIFMGSVSMKM